MLFACRSVRDDKIPGKGQRTERQDENIDPEDMEQLMGTSQEEDEGQDEEGDQEGDKEGEKECDDHDIVELGNGK